MGNTNKLMKGLGSGDLGWQDDFRLTDDNQIDDLFKIELDNGNVTINGTLTVQGVPITGAGGGTSGPAGGDLSGTYPNPLVEKTRGIKTSTTVVAVGSATAPSAGQVLVANSSTDATWQVPPAANGLKSSTTTVGVSTATAPTSGQVLTATSGTTATWQNAAGGAPTGIAGGDLSGTYPNPSVATVGAVSAANVALGANRANAGTNLNVPNAIVKRDINGDFVANLITSAGFLGNSSSTSALKSASTNVNVASATPPSSGQVLTATSSTSATWQTPGTITPAAAGSGSQVQFNEGGNVINVVSPLVTGNTISVNVDGTPVSQLFTTDTATTLNLWSASIEARPNVAASTYRDAGGGSSLVSVVADFGTTVALTSPTVTGGASQSAVFVSSGSFAADPNLLYSRESKSLLVGTEGRLDVIPGADSGLNGGAAVVASRSSESCLVFVESYGTGSRSQVLGASGRGTSFAPSAVLANDTLMVVGGLGFDGADFKAAPRGYAAIEFTAEQNFSPTAHGSAVRIKTVNTGTLTQQENAQFLPGGHTVFAPGAVGKVGIGTSGNTVPTEQLQVGGNITIPGGSAYMVGAVSGVSGSITYVESINFGAPSYVTKTLTFTKGIVTAFS